MVLEKLVRQRKYFDVNSKEDIEMATLFFSKFAWGSGGCPFILEFPYLTIPDMIKDKLLYKFLGINKIDSNLNHLFE